MTTNTPLPAQHIALLESLGTLVPSELHKLLFAYYADLPPEDYSSRQPVDWTGAFQAHIRLGHQRQPQETLLRFITRPHPIMAGNPATPW